MELDPRYPRLAIRVLAKIKGYCPRQSTDEPQVLAFAEMFAKHQLQDITVLDAAVLAVVDTPEAGDPGFTVTPRALTYAARKIRGTDPASMTDAERAEHEAICDAKAALDDLDDVSAPLALPHGMSAKEYALAQIASFGRPVDEPVSGPVSSDIRLTQQEIAQAARIAGPPQPLPCPECGAVDPCPHDVDDTAMTPGDASVR